MSVAPNRCRSTGSRSRPGRPRSVRRSSRRINPASRFDSPSRSRSRVVTRRVPNVGSDCPATRIGGPKVLFSTSRSSTISCLKVTRGVMLMTTPIGRYSNDVSGLNAAPPAASGVNAIDGTGMSCPRFSVSGVPSCPRNCGFATSRVCVSCSRKSMTAAGTAA